MLVRDAVSVLAIMCLYSCSQLSGEYVGNTEPSEMLLQGLD